jgi:hypothetical protein
MSIRVRGTITIQRKNSSRGAFNVGDLVTEIGEFEVKDSLIEEFEPGTYSGDFLIKFIAPDSYSWRGRVFVKVRATLDEILIDDADESVPSPAAPPEPDPLEQQQPQAAAPTPQPVQPTSDQATKPAVTRPAPATAAAGDLTLFGDEIYQQVQAQATVKLDPTVDREQFREQRDRLKVIGYIFDAKSQSWAAKVRRTEAEEDLCF